MIGLRLLAQDPLISASSIYHGMKPGDSVTVYQCYVVDPQSGPLQPTDYASTPQVPYTISSKIILRKYADSVVASVYTTHIRDFPNRKFSGLKIRERPYWQFTQEQRFKASQNALTNLARLEMVGREAMEYDYPLTKHTRNQVILKRGKKFRQLVYEDPLRVLPLIRPASP